MHTLHRIPCVIEVIRTRIIPNDIEQICELKLLSILHWTRILYRIPAHLSKQLVVCCGCETEIYPQWLIDMHRM